MASDTISCDRCGKPVKDDEIWIGPDEQTVCEDCYYILRDGDEDADNLRANGPHQAVFHRKEYE